MCTKVLEHIKPYFIAIIKYVEGYTHTGVAAPFCAPFCAPRVLYQSATGSSKHALENTAKLQQKKKKKVDVVLVANRRFVRRRSLWQKVVQLGDWS